MRLLLYTIEMWSLRLPDHSRQIELLDRYTTSHHDNLHRQETLLCAIVADDFEAIRSHGQCAACDYLQRSRWIRRAQNRRATGRETGIQPPGCARHVQAQAHFWIEESLYLLQVDGDGC
jgi:hypothetical protein